MEHVRPKTELLCFNTHVNAPLEQSQVTCANSTNHPGPGERLFSNLPE